MLIPIMRRKTDFCFKVVLLAVMRAQDFAVLCSEHKAMLTGWEVDPEFYGVMESGAARLIRMRTSVDLLMEKAGGELGAVMAKKSARCTSSR